MRPLVDPTTDYGDQRGVMDIVHYITYHYILRQIIILCN